MKISPKGMKRSKLGGARPKIQPGGGKGNGAPKGVKAKISVKQRYK